MLRPGGLALLLLPDPCTRGFMDRFRLALPAAHHVEEYRSRQVRPASLHATRRRSRRHLHHRRARAPSTRFTLLSSRAYY